MSAQTSEKFIEGIGRRKQAIARVRLTPSAKQSYKVNEKALNEYFTTADMISIVESPFTKVEGEQKFEITVLVRGGGLQSQAESLRLGIARALVEFKAELRGELKKAGYLKRNPRVKERKKFGLLKARKRKQWSKR